MSLNTDSGELSEALSKQSFGFSGADIANICNEASTTFGTLQNLKM